jgi:hypothetical protein
MVSYNDDFALMMFVILVSLPALLLVRVPRRARAAGAQAQPLPAAAADD